MAADNGSNQNQSSYMLVQSISNMLNVPDENDEHANEFPWDGAGNFVRKLFGSANQLLQQLSRWPDSNDLGIEDAGCVSPGLVWLHVW